MGRRVKDARLENRTSRLKLAVRSEPYWRLISEGCHIGYYSGARVGKWVARFRRPGSGIGYAKATLGEADDVRDANGETILRFDQADAAARRWFDDVSGGGCRRKAETVSDALDAYLLNFTGKSLASTKARADAIIRPALGHLKLASLTRNSIKDWHKERGRSPAMLRTKNGAEKRNERPATTDDSIRARRATANRDLTVLKAALNRFSEDHPGLPAHAWREVKPFKGVDTPILRYLSDDEVRAFVRACDPRFRPVVQAALLTGARYGNICRARAGDVDLTANTLWLPNTKGGKARIVYLEQEGVRLFSAAVRGKQADDLVFTRPDGKGWNRSQQARYVDRACIDGKIARATFRDLRRTYGSRLSMGGTPLTVVSEALGHADERITRRHYAHLSPSYASTKIREAAAGLSIVEAEQTVVALATRRKARSL